LPEGCGKRATDRTTPETDAWTAAESGVDGSAIICPSKTLSPRFTNTLAAGPACCKTGITTLAGGGKTSMGESAEAFFSLGR
jgi:hypothetical protein